MRPLIKPALRRLWRDPATLQLGIDPAHAVVLAGIDLADAGLLELLDGTRDLDELSVEAERRGHPSARIHALVTTLGDAAVLDEPTPAGQPVDGRRPPDLLSLSLLHRPPGEASRLMAERGRAIVEILGAGRVGASLAMLLAAAGVGRIELTDSAPLRPADVAPGGIRSLGSRQASRAEAARQLLPAATTGALGGPVSGRGLTRAARAATGGNPSGAEREGATVVLAPTGNMVPPEWLAVVRHRPHLPVVIRETTAVIGPLVLPGRTPCLRCVELTRGDRDPAWPALAAQLIGDPQGVQPCDVGLASAAASIASLHVLAWLDRGTADPPPSVGGTVELSLVDLRLRRRTVRAHPGCGCGAIDAQP